MDIAAENRVLKTGTQLTATLSEKLNTDLVDYANNRGIKPADALSELAEMALRTDGLMQGKVTDLSPEAIEQMKQAQLDILREFNSTQPTEAEAVAIEQPVNENTVVFDAAAETRELIAEINKQRILKGLAPIEKSLAELLYHWGENLSTHSILAETTGLKYEWYRKTVKAIALAERAENGAKSNVIESTGIFGRFPIIETPATA